MLIWGLSILLQLAEPTVVNKPMPNFSKRFRDTTKSFIVLHYDESDSYLGTRRWLIKKRNSYHYYIERSGRIIKLVDPKYEANHAGTSLWRSYLRMNRYSIGICLQNKVPQEYTEKQYVSLAWLIKAMQERFKDRDSTAHIILGHEDIAIPRGRKHDPGIHFDWDKLYSLLGYDYGDVRRN